MYLSKYLIIFVILVLGSKPLFAYTLRAEVDYITGRTEWNENNTVNQINYSTAIQVMGEYLYQYNERAALSLGGSYASYTMDTPTPSQPLSEDSFSMISLHGNGILLIGRDLFVEGGFFLMRVPYYGNGISTTTASAIAIPAIKAGLGINSKVSFGLMRIMFRYYYHLSGTFESQSISGSTQEYKAEFYMGRKSNYGFFFKFKTSNMEGDYELINSDRSIGLIFKLSTDI